MTHKCGICLPHLVDEEIYIDRVIGIKLWSKVFNKEMSNVKASCETQYDHTSKQISMGKEPGLTMYQEIGCHIDFKVRIDFTRNVRFVAVRYTNKTTILITYPRFVSRDIICLLFLIVVLNGVDIPGAVSKKYPSFCKCLRLSTSVFAVFSNFSGH